MLEDCQIFCTYTLFKEIFRAILPNGTIPFCYVGTKRYLKCLSPLTPRPEKQGCKMPSSSLRKTGSPHRICPKDKDRFNFSLGSLDLTLFSAMYYRLCCTWLTAFKGKRWAIGTGIGPSPTSLYCIPSGSKQVFYEEKQSIYV